VKTYRVLPRCSPDGPDVKRQKIAQRFGIKIKRLLARPKRFELLTPRFVVWCSILLSYGRGAS
jgi:hypothetical protein